ncbi:MAG: MarR family transcriptional regulator [Spirochaetales bacterium]|nr:MarR family transcriptional regulator [Spirochaetales bacterium]
MTLELELIHNIRSAGDTIRSLYEGRGSQKNILMTLLKRGSMSQRDLTEGLEIKPGSASEVLGKLEEAGLLARTISKSDRRTFILELTAEGRKRAEEYRKAREERHRRMFSCLSVKEKEELSELLSKLNCHLDSEFKGP